MTLPRRIRKGVLIGRNTASDLCTAVGCLEFCKKSSKHQRRSMFERNYSFFHHSLLSLSLRDVPKTVFLANQNGGGAQEIVRGGRTGYKTFLFFFEKKTLRKTNKQTNQQTKENRKNMKHKSFTRVYHVRREILSLLAFIFWVHLTKNLYFLGLLLSSLPALIPSRFSYQLDGTTFLFLQTVNIDSDFGAVSVAVFSTIVLGVP